MKKTVYFSEENGQFTLADSNDVNSYWEFDGSKQDYNIPITNEASLFFKFEGAHFMDVGLDFVNQINVTYNYICIEGTTTDTKNFNGIVDSSTKPILNDFYDLTKGGLIIINILINNVWYKIELESMTVGLKYKISS